MSPEQSRSSGQIDQRSDVYALGCILFELLTGRTPFDGDLRQLIGRHQRAVPPRARSFAPEVSQGLDDLIDSMLAKDPAARPQTMGALQRALEGLGARSVPVATTMLPVAAQLVALAPTPPAMPAQVVRGSGPRVFDTTDELLPPPPPPPAPRLSSAPAAGPAPWAPPARNPALMLPPEGQHRRRRNVAIAAAVAFVLAGLVTAMATREQAIAGTAPRLELARPSAP
jgi:serine/threonine-protein kinase